MSKLNSRLQRKNSSIFLILLAGIAQLVLACSPPQSATVVPTQTLIPSTATPTPTATATSTATSLPVIRPQDVLSQQPELFSDLRSDVQRQLAQIIIEQLEITADAVDLIAFQDALWEGRSVSCTPPNEPLARQIPGYRVIVLAGDTVYQYHTDDNVTVLLCDESAIDDVDASVRVMVDPVVSELVALARVRLSDLFGLPASRLQVETIESITWDDTSLGCPLQDETYLETKLEGYRITLTDGEETYTFHTDLQNLRLCNNN